MGGMPLLELSNWLHQVTSLYATAIPVYFYINNIVGPKVLEPVFCRDYLMAHFDKIATAPATTSGQGAAFSPTAGKAPRIPAQLFARGASVRGRVVGMGAQGLAAMFRR